MSKDPPRDWRERWQPFAIVFSLLAGMLIVFMLIRVAIELIRLKSGS